LEEHHWRTIVWRGRVRLVSFVGQTWIIRKVLK